MSAKAIVLVLFAGICLACHSAETCISDNSTVAVPGLGFTYTPPPGMNGKTSAAGVAMRILAGTYSSKAAQLILDLSSKDDDTSLEWHQVWAFIFSASTVARRERHRREGENEYGPGWPACDSGRQATGRLFRGARFSGFGVRAVRNRR